MSEMLSQIFKSLASKIKPGEVSDAPCLLCPVGGDILFQKCVNLDFFPAFASKSYTMAFSSSRA